MENKLTPELIEKAKQAGSAEALLALAKENDIEFSEEEAKAYFEQFTKSGELSDDELDNVAGGGCYNNDGRLIVTVGNSCDYWLCKNCDTAHTLTPRYNYMDMYPCNLKKKDKYKCSGCKFMSYEKGLWLCNCFSRRKK